MTTRRKILAAIIAVAFIAGACWLSFHYDCRDKVTVGWEDRCGFK